MDFIKLFTALTFTCLTLLLQAQNNPVTFDPEGENGASGDQFGIKVTETGNATTKFHIYRNFTHDTEDIDRIVIDNNGKIGIGSSTPEARLHVYDFNSLNSTANYSKPLTVISGKTGNNTFKNTVWLKRDINGDSWQSVRLHDGVSIDGSYKTPGVDTRVWWERDPADNIQSWGQANQTYMTLKSGKLGIGTTTMGSHKLAVHGSIGAREITVEMTEWQDQVFEDDYELRSLEEIEQYISEHNHLPEIPSEQEVIDDGVNLGDMVSKLLQKIEENTLHMIELNKQLQSQNRRVNQLEEENKKLKVKISN